MKRRSFLQAVTALLTVPVVVKAADTTSEPDDAPDWEQDRYTPGVFVGESPRGNAATKIEFYRVHPDGGLRICEGRHLRSVLADLDRWPG